MSKPRIAVIGGGVTGLTAAYELRNEAEVTVFEASDRLGGKVLTGELDGLQIEWGPDSLLARDDGPVRLLTELGLADDIVEPHDFGAWIATGQKLKRLPERSVLGVPTSPVSLAFSGLLSPAGVLRAAGDLVLPKTPVGEDISVGRLIRARFGDQVADRIVAPLMSGIRAGDIDTMSLEMAAPQIAEVARRHRSLTLGLRRTARTARRPRFIGLRSGMSTLAGRLAERSHAEIRLGAAVSKMDRQLAVDDEPFDGVILAIPDHAAAKLLGETYALVPWRSTGVTNLVFRRGSVRIPEGGTGILVPPSSGRALVGCTWFTKKWPHLDPPDGRVVLRCVHSPESDHGAVTADLNDLLGIRDDPVASRTHTWDAALPAFLVGHRMTMEAVQQLFEREPIRLAGAGYLATGLNDCLAHGRAAAGEVLAAIQT